MPASFEFREIVYSRTMDCRSRVLRAHIMLQAFNAYLRGMQTLNQEPLFLPLAFPLFVLALFLRCLAEAAP